MIPAVDQRGHQLQGRSIAIFGLRVALQISKQIAEVRKNNRLIGCTREAFPEQRHSIEQTTLLSCGQGEEMVDVRRFFVSVRQLLKDGYRLGELSFIEVRDRCGKKVFCLGALQFRGLPDSPLHDNLETSDPKQCSSRGGRSVQFKGPEGGGPRDGSGDYSTVGRTRPPRYWSLVALGRGSAKGGGPARGD